ncbi:STELLO glycosyltransferase domain containing protein [Nitzschia inconspicua]|uniref:STELLO glycosyltransferase domain containing protein n=1 Tax=Nitzschia inconspicua TaxID=303405 RepID=A0A9K3PLG0_9STRA|nr:STELLO glycosyltransferase domain containing protein [Nitzschia inconspicua]
MAVSRSPTTFVSTCFLVLLFYFVPAMVFQMQMVLPTKTTTNKETPAMVPEMSVESMLNDAVNSATGKLFWGQPIRTFSGERVFRDYQPPKQHSPTKPMTSLAKKCDRWNVVTTIFAPSEAVLRAASVSGWCTVIVADTKTPKNYMQDAGFSSASLNKQAIQYLSVEDQQTWYQRAKDTAVGVFLKATPFRHFSRKNVGYLYAIQHGARFIFDFDDDNLLPLDGSSTQQRVLPPLTNTTHLQGARIVESEHIAFNHHPLMGAPIKNSWPRGFPLPYIQERSSHGTIVETDVTISMESVAVLQFCADGNPDVDAVHRLVHPLPMLFDPFNHATKVSKETIISTQGALMVPTNSFAPYNAQATLHTYPVMWALLLPLSVPGRVSDIWRAYFAQAIYKDLGLSVVMLPPKVQQERNEHNYLADMQAELDLYFKGEKLLEFLRDWSSNANSIPGRIEDLWIELYERGYIEVKDISVVKAWLAALAEIGYEFPTIV